MNKILSIVPRWFPALFLMLVIFVFSSQPGDNLPNFMSWDGVVKKMGHSIGYGLLALSYFHFLHYDKNKYWLAWFLALLFSITDEIHQSFVPSRHASIVDVLVFDNFGAALGLWLYFIYRRKYETKIDPT